MVSICCGSTFSALNQAAGDTQGDVENRETSGHAFSSDDHTGLGCELCSFQGVNCREVYVLVLVLA